LHDTPIQGKLSIRLAVDIENTLQIGELKQFGQVMGVNLARVVRRCWKRMTPCLFRDACLQCAFNGQPSEIERSVLVSVSRQYSRLPYVNSCQPLKIGSCLDLLLGHRRVTDFLQYFTKYASESRYGKLGYNGRVKRISAILLLLAMTLMVVEPAVLAESSSGMPACCRRNGLHHCAGMGSETPDGASLQAGARTCPLFPRATATRQNHFSSPKTAFVLAAAIVSTAVISVPLDVTYRHSKLRSHLRRGPPVLS
jgi:hypothetical protein